MAYWLCITTEENWNVIKQKNIWGVQEKHRNTIAKVKPGDKCLIYVMSTRKDDEVIPPRIMAVYEVTSEVFKDSSRIFKPPARNKNETFPLRIMVLSKTIYTKNNNKIHGQKTSLRSGEASTSRRAR